MQTLIFLTSRGTGPSQKLMDLVDERFGKDVDIISGYELLDPQTFLTLIENLRKTNELKGILVSVIGEAVYYLSSDSDIENVVKLVRNTGNVFEQVSDLARQLANEENKG